MNDSSSPLSKDPNLSSLLSKDPNFPSPLSKDPNFPSPLSKGGLQGGKSPSRWKLALLAGLAALILQTSLAPAVAQIVSYSNDPQTVVASYSLVIGELEDADPGPSVRVYGNGRAVVHRPQYMKGAGDFGTQLSKAEMDALMTTLVANGLLDFDPVAVQQAKRDSQLNRGSGGATVLSETTDPSIMTIELRVRRNSGAGGAAAGAEVSKTVKWVGLESDVEHFPDITALRQLNAAQQQLRAIMERSDLVPE